MKGDKVIIKYTGNLYDLSVGLENYFRGKQYVYYTLHLAADSLRKKRR